MINSEFIKQKALEYGADIVGIGDINLYEGVSPLHDPRCILPNAKCVIGVGFRIPRGIIKALKNGTQNYTYTSLGVKSISEELCETFLLKMARVIENEGYEACLQRSTPNIRAKDDMGTNPEVIATRQLIHAESVGQGKPAPDVILDFEHSAVICGLGTYGYRGNILTPEFGPFQRFVFIITNAPLETDPVISKSICDECQECAKACPGHAIKKNGTYDKWQCSVYYRGAHESNPYVNDDFLKDYPERQKILNGDKRFTPEEAVDIYEEMNFLPNTQYGYVPCLCNKACDVACYSHLQKRGLLDKGHQDRNDIKAKITEEARKLGADLVGFSDIGRFSDSKILRIFPETKSVIGLGFRVLRGSTRGIEEGSSYYQFMTMSIENIEENIIPVNLLRLSAFIEDMGYDAFPQKKHHLIMEKESETNPEREHNRVFRGNKTEIQIDWRQAAIACGLGEIGLSGQVLTPEYGPYQRFCFILTDAEIEPDIISRPYLCDKCGDCLKSCPGNAFSEEARMVSICDIDYDVHDLNSWQCAVYYNGANMEKNPFMPPGALMDIPGREAVLRGNSEISEKNAKIILDAMDFYPGARHSVAASMCGRACDMACYMHLEEQGKLLKTFQSKFRKRKEWRLKS